MEREYEIFNIYKLSFLKLNFKTLKALIALFNRFGLSSVINTPDAEKFIFF